MLQTRVIPCLLMGKAGGLYKTVKFKNPTYVGDPIVAVKIFNEKEVDELCLLDITAGIENRKPDFERISEIASEAFMPMSYGGGIRSFEDAEKLFTLGIEKVVINTTASSNPKLLTEIAKVYGSQAVIASIDVKKGFFGKYDVHVSAGQKALKVEPVAYAKRMEEFGAGEILLTSIDREGTMEGYDVELIRSVADAVQIPVVANGGAGKLQDLKDATDRGGASAAAAGSLFVFHGKHRAVLINYPSRTDIDALFAKNV